MWVCSMHNNERKYMKCFSDCPLYPQCISEAVKMTAPRFNAEDVRQKALLKATADTYGGTLPLPRRPRRPLTGHGGSPASWCRPLTSTPHSSLPRHGSRTPSSSGRDNRVQLFNEETGHGTYKKGSLRVALSTTSSSSCSTLSPAPHISHQHHFSHHSHHKSPLSASCRRFYEERVKVCLQIKLDAAQNRHHRQQDKGPNEVTTSRDNVISSRDDVIDYAGASLDSSVEKLRNEMVSFVLKP